MHKRLLLPLLAVMACASGASAREAPPPPPGAVLSLVCTAQLKGGGTMVAYFDLDDQGRLLAPAGPAIAQAAVTPERITFSVGQMKIDVDRRTGVMALAAGAMGDLPGSCVTRDGKAAPF